MPTTNAPVIGLDNQSPLYDPNGHWQIWNIGDIYLGTVGAGKFVPRVGDVVMEIVGNAIIRYVVHAIDPLTFVAELNQEDNSNITNGFTTDDILYGVGPGTQSDTYRVYLDQSVTPHRLSVDRRLKVGGNLCVSCKIFKGTNVQVGGEVISAIYDNSGGLLSQNVPLEVVATTTLNNSAIKVVSNCYTSFSLQDGELVTAVFYDADGFVVSKRQLLIENTRFVIGTDAYVRYITGIGLETPFLGITNNRLISYPINVPLTALNLIGVVYYSDGSQTRLAVDGNRFSVMGLDAYTATNVGQTSQLVLNYVLSNGEQAITSSLGINNNISEIYDIVTVTSNGNYAVRLFCYPTWIDSVSGYSLKWYLYDLDRSASFDVTGIVVINSTYSLFQPIQYGVKQTLHVTINLAAVNGSYNNFNHVQVVDITLLKQGTARPDLDDTSNWLVSNTASLANTYGDQVYATYKTVNVSTVGVRISPEFVTQAIWLDKMYTKSTPLFDPLSELSAPVPTHFILIVNGVQFEQPLSNWDQQININQPIVNSSNIFIKFIRRTVNTDLQLSIVSLSAFQVDNTGSFI